MAILGIHCPHDVGRLFSQIDIGLRGIDREPLGHQHVTLLHLGDDVPIDTLAKAIVATYGVTSKTRPFTVQTNRVTSFPPHPKHGTVPIICPLVSEPLHEMQGRLKGALDGAKIEYSKTFPVFKPHVTLGYAKDPLVFADHAADKDIPSIEWGVADIVLWGGDEGDLRFSANFPLSIGKTAGLKTASVDDVVYRAFVRLAMHRQRRAHVNGQCLSTCPCHDNPHAEPHEDEPPRL
jgi:2'-5' RNA ligase